jgi:hypothetical protein
VVEFWPDELVRTCRNCRGRVINAANQMKCLEWCAGAAQCLAALRGPGGADMTPLRDELATRVQEAFGVDERSFVRTMAVVEMAERIGREVGAEPLVLLPAAFLHGVGGGAGGRKAAADLLEGLPLPGAVRERVLDVIEHQDDGKGPRGPEEQALSDARLIVALRGGATGAAEGVVAREARTEVGRRLRAEALKGTT